MAAGERPRDLLFLDVIIAEGRWGRAALIQLYASPFFPERCGWQCSRRQHRAHLYERAINGRGGRAQRANTGRGVAATLGKAVGPCSSTPTLPERQFLLRCGEHASRSDRGRSPWTEFVQPGRGTADGGSCLLAAR